MPRIWHVVDRQLRPIPVRNGLVDIFYAGTATQLRNLQNEIERWQQTILGNPSPSQRDSLELAQSAIRRWEEDHERKRTARSVTVLKAMILDNPHAEVRVLAVARARWLRLHKVVGVICFRRTWCNNVALDVIAVHPVLDEQRESPITLLGTGLIHHVFRVAEAIGADAIWGECTQHSNGFYAGFKDESVPKKDLIVLPSAEYLPLISRIEELQLSKARKRVV